MLCQSLGTKEARAPRRAGRMLLGGSGTGTTGVTSLQFLQGSWEEFDRYKLIQDIWAAESWR